jgi:hypothetical protein
MTPPLLFLIFNRPQMTEQVMTAIRGAQPERLYVAADGPRADSGEEALCEQARRIATNVDWPCEVKTLFRDRNLGCRLGVSMAIEWFFEQEEEGIILEDDCIPSQSFFRYCGELLDRYRHDERIMCISGANFQQGRYVSPFSYYFSRYNHCWGWATWRRAWRLHDVDMQQWDHYRRSGSLESWSDGDKTFTTYWTNIFDSVARGEIDTWDYQWAFTCWAQHGLTCLPDRNLVTNIGFGAGATHTADAKAAGSNLARREMEFPLRHPPLVMRNVEADHFSHVYHFGVRSSGSLLRIYPVATLARARQWWGTRN